MSTTPPPHQFSDDAPKTNPWSEDRLGYRPFAERVANMILNLDAPKGYVIGLHGAWGSGKSTILNFVEAFIDKHNEERLTETERLRVVNFSPWIVSGHQDLVSAFFKVLSEALADKAGWKWAVRVMRVGSDPLIDAAATVGLVADPSGGVASRELA
jgi:predicted KAP-like P-loop ATPase